RAIEDAKIDNGQPRIGPLVTPGTYTVRLTVDGQTLSRPLVIKLDPRERIGKLADVLAAARIPMKNFPLDLVRAACLNEGGLEEQLQFSLHIRDDISRLADLVHQLRAVKRQLVERDELLANRPEAEVLVKASKELAGKLTELEEKLHNP